MSIQLRKKIRDTAFEVWDKIQPEIKKQKGWKYTGTMAKNACLLYCNLKQYAEPDNKNFWEEVAKYIDKRF